MIKIPIYLVHQLNLQFVNLVLLIANYEQKQAIDYNLNGNFKIFQYKIEICIVDFEKSHGWIKKTVI